MRKCLKDETIGWFPFVDLQVVEQGTHLREQVQNGGFHGRCGAMI
jgi:hypothetical protein